MHSSRSGRPVMAKHSIFASREEQGVHPSCVALLAATLNRIRRAIALSEGPRATDSVRSFGLQRNMFASFISPVCSQARNKAKIPFNVCSRLVRIPLGLRWVCAYEPHTSTVLRCTITKRSMDASEEPASTPVCVNRPPFEGAWSCGSCVCVKAQLALPMQPQEEQEYDGGTPQSCQRKGRW
jgi:hypothetical protein